MAVLTNGRVRHNGALYLPFEVVRDAEHAKILLAAGLATDNGVEGLYDEPDEANERIVTVAEAIPQLPETAWTKDGKPNLDALSEAVGFKVDADLRAKAMERIG